MVAASAPTDSLPDDCFFTISVAYLQTNRIRGFRILNEICERFKLPFSSVKVVGSAHTGYSYFKERDFVPGESDLDVAIISPSLFQDYSEQVYWMTHRYSDLTKFSRDRGVSPVQGTSANI